MYIEILMASFIFQQNQKWYVRVRAGNMKGFGAPAKPDPAYVVPSCKY